MTERDRDFDRTQDNRPGYYDTLLAAQRAWITYRDANCSFYFDPDGGTIARVNSNSCFMSATATRAKELETLQSGWK